MSVDEARALWYDQISKASLKIFETFMRTPRRHLIENWAFVYYVGMMFPFARELGLYERFRDELELWDFDERASAVYYELNRNQFARVTVPTKLFDPSELISIHGSLDVAIAAAGIQAVGFLEDTPEEAPPSAARPSSRSRRSRAHPRGFGAGETGV